FKDVHLDRLYPFDRAKAKALLTQAGWAPGPDGIMVKGGQRLSLSWLAARGRYPKDGEITEAIQAMFKEVGVEAKVQVLEWAAVFQHVVVERVATHLLEDRGPFQHLHLRLDADLLEHRLDRLGDLAVLGIAAARRQPRERQPLTALDHDPVGAGCPA